MSWCPVLLMLFYLPAVQGACLARGGSFEGKLGLWWDRDGLVDPVQVQQSSGSQPEEEPETSFSVSQEAGSRKQSS